MLLVQADKHAAWACGPQSLTEGRELLPPGSRLSWCWVNQLRNSFPASRAAPPAGEHSPVVSAGELLHRIDNSVVQADQVAD